MGTQSQSVSKSTVIQNGKKITKVTTTTIKNGKKETKTEEFVENVGKEKVLQSGNGKDKKSNLINYK